MLTDWLGSPLLPACPKTWKLAVGCFLLCLNNIHLQARWHIRHCISLHDCHCNLEGQIVACSGWMHKLCVPLFQYVPCYREVAKKPHKKPKTKRLIPRPQPFWLTFRLFTLLSFVKWEFNFHLNNTMNAFVFSSRESCSSTKCKCSKCCDGTRDVGMLSHLFHRKKKHLPAY